MVDVMDNKPNQHLIKYTLNIIGENKKSQPSTWFMYFCTLTAHLLMVTFGHFIAWPSSVIPKLTSNNTDINPLGYPCTSLQISIIASIPCFAASLTVMVTGKLSDIFGRKKVLFGLCISIICCFGILAFARHIYLYYIALFILGLNMSTAYSNVSIYNSEIADDKNRTLLGGFLGSALPIGILLGYIYGAIFPTIKMLTLMYTIPAFLHLLLYYFTIESPVFLIRKNRKVEAINALYKLRKYSNSMDIEIEYTSLKKIDLNARIRKLQFLNLFNSRSSMKGLLLSSLLPLIQQLSGVTVVYMYMVPIFTEAGSTLSGNAISILVGSVQMFVVIAAAFIVNRFGRRPLVLLSCLGCSISMFLLAVYFYLKQIDSKIIDELQWLPVLSIIMFIFLYGLGLGPVPVAIIAELFDNELRATGVASAITVEAFTIFVLTFAFPLLSETYGIFSCILVYSISTLVGFVVFFYILPETRGKSFKEIQDILSK